MTNYYRTEQTIYLSNLVQSTSIDEFKHLQYIQQKSTVKP